MKRAILLGLLLGLSACDEPTIITHVDKLSHMEQSDLFVMQDANGIPVVFHGLPFRETSAETLASAMQPPSGSAQSVRFYASPPETQHGGHGWRLVLHFNPQGGIPNSQQDCRRTGAADTAGLPTQGFSVNATFCKGTEWQAHGFMKVLQIQNGDTKAFTRVMKQLLLAIFPKNTDPDR
ncbi:MAG: hypothetical protein AB8B85_14395 [Paracoccaceae bacterium]